MTLLVALCVALSVVFALTIFGLFIDMGSLPWIGIILLVILGIALSVLSKKRGLNRYAGKNPAERRWGKWHWIIVVVPFLGLVGNLISSEERSPLAIILGVLLAALAGYACYRVSRDELAEPADSASTTAGKPATTADTTEATKDAETAEDVKTSKDAESK